MSSSPAAPSTSGAHEVMEANAPAFILATSGTTATPKLAVHTHGGYQVHIASMGRWCFGLDAVRRVVGHLRRRLDRRPQLHGVRAASRRLHDGGLRRRARSPDAGRPLAARGGGLRRHGHLHLADGRPPAAALRRGHARGRRSRDAEARGVRRRGAEPAGLGLAAAHRARRARPRDRPHVADRDGRTGVRQPVRAGADADQAGRRRPAAARHRGERGRRSRAARARPTRRGSW